ncbi:hypothetical protein CHS0354_035198 [Potamilus streckersoni]|uniref:Periplasmic binding protein domain-containing protein n=1 Tax=Potamilus streckersoni TaxID=2493646 RepID=A0AAE0S2B7_9BIVA|nr:hypothetical protein CHS0354_035198 [Potamilus streckersoni]
MALFDDNFLTIEDAQNDVAKQLNQIQNFIAAKVDAIVVNPVDTDATEAMSKLAAEAGIPLVYVNREPVNVNKLPKGQAFVASNEQESGTLETQEVCRLLKAAGKGKGANIVVMMGELSNQAARMRTKDVEDVIATKDCSFMKIVQKQTANWKRTEAADLMTNWLSAGVKFDAVVANNDEMALGAIQAMKSAGISMKTMIVGGVDATQEALAAMAAGDLDVTVFQDAAGQGQGAIDAAIQLSDKKSVKSKVYIPFQLVTPANMKKFMSKN